MLRDGILARAVELKTEYNCENVYITGECALACTGLIVESQSRSPVFLELPAICHRLYDNCFTGTRLGRFGATLTVKDRTNVNILPSEVTIADTGMFVNLGNGLWAESLESYLGNTDPTLLDAIRAHLNKTYTE